MRVFEEKKDSHALCDELLSTLDQLPYRETLKDVQEREVYLGVMSGNDNDNDDVEIEEEIPLRVQMRNATRP